MAQNNVADVFNEANETLTLMNALGELNLFDDLTGPNRLLSLEMELVQEQQTQEKEEFKRNVKQSRREMARLERLDAAFRARQREILEIYSKMAKDEMEQKDRLSKAELEEEQAWLAEDIADAEKQIERRHWAELERLRKRERQGQAEVTTKGEESKVASEDK